MFILTSKTHRRTHKYRLTNINHTPIHPIVNYKYIKNSVKTHILAQNYTEVNVKGQPNIIQEAHRQRTV